MYENQLKKVFFVSLLATVLLACLKLAVGYFYNSLALIYDALESIADLFIFASLYGAALLATKPPDSEHLYGHTKIESLAALYTGMAIFTGGLYLCIEALSHLAGTLKAPGIPAFLTAISVVITKEALYIYTRSNAAMTGSPVLSALALDHHKDALSSLITVAGTSASILNLPILDPLAALLTSLVIVSSGAKAAYSASSDLLDKSPEREIIDKISRAIGSVEGVKRISALKARKSGKDILVDVDIEVDENLSVSEAHEIASVVRERTMDEIKNVKDVIVHVEPYRKKV